MIGCKTHQKRNWLKVQESFTQSRVQVGTRPKTVKLPRLHAPMQQHKGIALVGWSGVGVWWSQGLNVKTITLNQQDNYLHEHSLQQGPLASKYSMSRGKPNGKAQPHFNYLWPGHIFQLCRRPSTFAAWNKSATQLAGLGRQIAGSSVTRSLGPNYKIVFQMWRLDLREPTKHTTASRLAAPNKMRSHPGTWP